MGAADQGLIGASRVWKEWAGFGGSGTGFRRRAQGLAMGVTKRGLEKEGKNFRAAGQVLGGEGRVWEGRDRSGKEVVTPPRRHVI